MKKSLIKLGLAVLTVQICCAPAVAGLLTARPHEAKREDPLWLSAAGTASGRKEVSYFLKHSSPPLVVLNWGSSEGLAVGTILRSIRHEALGPSADHHHQALAIPTGELKVVKVEAQQALAVVTHDGTEISAEAFPDHRGVMAGDQVELPRYLVARRKQVLPDTTLYYHDLFADPKATPFSFELTPQGRQTLDAAASALASARLGLLLVKGFTDSEGPADSNQVESYQRALTVRQFLIEELQFDASRVVALGFGEAAPADHSNTSGARARNRRIVLELVSPPPASPAR